MARVEITMCDFCGVVKESEECKSLSIETKTAGSPLAKYRGVSWENDDLIPFPDICPECYTKFSEALCDLLDTLNIKPKPKQMEPNHEQEGVSKGNGKHPS